MIRMTGAAIIGLALAGVACGGDRRGAPDTGGASAAAGAPTDPRADIFVSKGCPQCHSIAALGIKSAAEVGPDLTLAYEDVKNRFGVELEQFLRNPTGTMQVVLSSTIQLTPAERDSIIHILKGLYEEREQRGEADQSMPAARERGCLRDERSGNVDIAMVGFIAGFSDTVPG